MTLKLWVKSVELRLGQKSKHHECCSLMLPADKETLKSISWY